MGRHSRRGRAPKGDTADPPAFPAARPDTRTTGTGTGRRRPPAGPQAPSPPTGGAPARGVPRLPEGWVPQGPGGPPGQGASRPGAAPAGAAPRYAGGGPSYSDRTQTGGGPRLPDGTPAHGFPRLPDGTPEHGSYRFQDGTPAHGFPRLPDGNATRGGAPRHADGTPARGMPGVRGGHPEQRETGGGWGEARAGSGYGMPGAAPQAAPRGPGQGVPRGRPGPPPPGQRYGPSAAGAGPRQAYVDAFGDDDRFASRSAGTATAFRADSYSSVTDWDEEVEHKAPPRGPEAGPEKARGGKGRAFTGIAAAAVTTVLAVVVAGQVAGGGEDDSAARAPQASNGVDREAKDSASRTDNRAVPSTKPSAATLSYAQQMTKRYPLAAGLKGAGEFEAIPGLAKAPGPGQKFTYRVDVEKALGLDGELFAQAVQKTLNDDRSWAHGGGRTFERISSGKPDFVITLASPGTTAFWCAKSGLDTTEDNVSCDSAATDRVMINAYRWAQGSETYGDKMYAYRQMLINHEVGHRLGYGHVSCSVDGGLAPVMQQQTKFLDHDGISCRPNPWPFPGS
ncbi:DUF3152 domain-containing protein [Streptomyces sp. BV286]|uniref:DUF3152 domain-containing protein n=1 Tax=Streptomyces sp. BV286 TaxID=2849672 RepID=UPI001C2EC512|nr:DUF3152 domain-containing protein [Streptomyces sp. BV286]MBV1942753.1 DUF3152 domain-containing protein [Streptomyces sp. BV286]